MGIEHATAQRDRLITAGTTARTALMGTGCSYVPPGGGAATAFTGMVGGISERLRLEMGGLDEEVSAICRYTTSGAGFTAAVGGKVTVTATGTAYRVAEVIVHPLDPETKLLLAAVR